MSSIIGSDRYNGNTNSITNNQSITDIDLLTDITIPWQKYFD